MEVGVARLSIFEVGVAKAVRGVVRFAGAENEDVVDDARRELATSAFSWNIA